jgi:hypothetical protein
VDVLLKPAKIGAEGWLEALDRFRDPFMAKGRGQLGVPAR